MANLKKTKQGKQPSKAKKLQLNKETLKDLTAPSSGQVKGGLMPAKPGTHDRATLYPF